MKKGYRRLLAIGLCAAVFFKGPCQVQATEKDVLKQQNQKDQDRLEDIDDQVNELEGEQEGIDAEIETLSNEIAQIMASISLLEEEIEAKKAQIEQAKIDLEEAQKVERKQYEAMKIRVKAMYESGETSVLDIIFSASSMQDMLNKADYVEKMHEYDKKVFVNYQIARQNVEDLKETLEIEESELEAVQEGLEEERASVEEARSELEAISADYAVQISKAKQQAEIYKTQIKQRNAQIKKIEEEERRKAEEERKRKEEEERRRKEEEERRRKEEEAKKNNNNNNANTAQNNNNEDRDSAPANENASKVTAGKDTVASSSGSAKGKEVANYACGFVGNPYVYGGTSLTNGADCSGFVMSVYAAFGVGLPHSSSALQGVGYGVSDMQPGDIICYSGHVGIYIGNNTIVHASTPEGGIKYTSPVNYRPIVAIRRIF